MERPFFIFCTITSIFKQKDITVQTDTLAYVVLILPQDIISEVKDIIISPPSEKPFDKLCESYSIFNSVDAQAHPIIIPQMVAKISRGYSRQEYCQKHFPTKNISSI